MYARHRRQLREYSYRKSIQDKYRTIQERKDSVKRSLEENVPIHPDLREKALHYQTRGKFEDAGPELAVAIGTEMGGALASSEDDEYRWAGVEDPKIMITTSRDPSSRLKMFASELRLIFPNAQRMNRGKILFS